MVGAMRLPLCLPCHLGLVAGLLILTGVQVHGYCHNAEYQLQFVSYEQDKRLCATVKPLQPSYTEEFTYGSCSLHTVEATCRGFDIHTIRLKLALNCQRAILESAILLRDRRTPVISRALSYNAVLGSIELKNLSSSSLIKNGGTVCFSLDSKVCPPELWMGKTDSHVEYVLEGWKPGKVSHCLVTGSASLPQPASCTDGVKNGLESDIDCGGDCPTCAEEKACIGPHDCVSGVCTVLGVCRAATCSDGVKNGDETDVDCGGRQCAACGVTCRCPGVPSVYKCSYGCGCRTNSDCDSEFCSEYKTCSMPHCFDGLQGKDESDTDCGGDVCPRCLAGKRCRLPTDCFYGKCESGTCQPPRS